MKRKMKAPPATVLGQKIRGLAMAFRGTVPDRADGLEQAADVVDAMLHRDRELAVSLASAAGPELTPLERVDQVLEDLRVSLGEVLALALISGRGIASLDVGTAPAPKPTEKLRRMPAILERPKRREPELGSFPKDDVLAIGEHNRDKSLSPCASKVLQVLAQRHPKTTTRKQLAVFAGYAQSGGYSDALADLRGADYMRGDSQHLEATEAGLIAAGAVDLLPTGTALLEYWADRLPSFKKSGRCASSVLRAAVDAWPTVLGRNELAAAAGYTASGGYSDALALLRSLELLKGTAPSAELLEALTPVRPSRLARSN